MDLAHPLARIRWDRVGRWALLGVVAVIVYLYVGPMRSLWAARAEAERQRAAVAELRERNASLRERRRLGGPFTTQELVDLYEQGTGWVSDLAVATAPEHPQAWDVRVVGDAAFGRYVRGAVDWAGGRRL